MAVYVTWFGGPNYVGSEVPRDVERFDSVEDACTEAWNRLKCGHHFANTFYYVNQPESRALTPCVDESSYMEVFLADPSDATDYPEPDFEITYDAEGDEFVTTYLGERLYLEVSDG